MSRYYRSFLEESVVTPSYPASLKLFIDAGNPLSYSGSGTTVTDLIGTQNGTLINGVGYSSSNGGYFTFDGVNDYIDFGINTAIRPLSARTISMWVYVDVTAGASNWFYADTDRAVTGLKGIEIWLDAGGYRTILENNSSYQIVVNRSGVKGVWLYLTTSWNGTSLKAYYNGVLNSSVTQTIIPTSQTLVSTKIGTLDPSSGNLKGNISQMKIYNVQRSDAEVLTDFNEFKARYGY